MNPEQLAPPADYPVNIEHDLTEEKYSDRLYKLQTDIAKPKLFYENLKPIDLILLLQHDPWVQQLIANIASQSQGLDLNNLPATNNAAVKSLANTPAPMEARPSAPSRPALTASPSVPKVDIWRKELLEPLALLQRVRNDAELAALWLGADGLNESEPRQLLRVCVMSAQWEQIMQVAELLKKRCIQSKQAASADELAVLRGALDLYNLSAGGSKADLQSPAEGQVYSPDFHNRANTTGGNVAQCLLPALLNRGKKIVQPAVVLTR